MARMRAVLGEDPDYYWGWLKLTEWAAEAATAAEYLEAAEGMVRVASDDPAAAGYRADARHRLGDRAGAKDEFRRGFTGAPDHAYNGLRLFDLEREDEDLDAAARVLESLKVHVGGPYVVAREVQLAQSRGDRSTAIEALARLCIMPPGDSEWPLTAANRAFHEAGWDRQAESVFAAALDNPEVLPQVAGLWVEHCVGRRHWRCIRRIDSLVSRGDIGRRALSDYLAALARAKAGRRIAACLRRYYGVILEHTPCWGAVGYALTSVLRHRAAAGWLADWSDRGDAQPWMLINLVLSLRALGRLDEANRVSRRAMELPPDYTTPYHVTWLALDDLLDGNGREFVDRLDGLDRSSFDATNQYLFTLAELLRKRRQAEPVDRSHVRKSASREFSALNQKTSIPAEDYGAVLRTYRRAVRRLAADYGPGRRFFWTLIRRLQAPRLQR